MIFVIFIELCFYKFDKVMILYVWYILYIFIDLVWVKDMCILVCFLIYD